MTTLNGKTNLTLQNAPMLESEKKLGLIQIPKAIPRTYKLSRVTISILENLTKKFSKQARVKITMTQILELAIIYIRDKSFNDILPLDDK